MAKIAKLDAPRPNRVWFSILSWPADLTQDQRVIAVRAALGVDAFEARRIVASGTPTIARVVPEGPEIRRSVELLAKVDAVAFAPNESQLRAVPEPVRAKSLLAAIGAPKPMYAVEPWRGEGGVLVMEEICLIIRAVIKRGTTRIDSGVQIDLSPWDSTGDAYTGGAGSLLDTTSGRVDSHSPRQIIDVFRADGSRVRIDSDKFSFEVLGKDRGLTDAASADLLALRLAREAPHAIIDTGFARFRPAATQAAGLGKPRTATSSDGTSTTRTDRTPMFELYSRWRFVLHGMQSEGLSI